MPEVQQTRVIRHAYSPRVRVPAKISGPSKTKQSAKDECDINKIMARFQRTGLIDFVNDNQPQYNDISGLDYQEAMQIVASARSMFEELPSSMRTRFDNDPQKLLEFLEDPANRQEGVAIGLINPSATPLPGGSVERDSGPPDPVSGDVAGGKDPKGSKKGA